MRVIAHDESNRTLAAAAVMAIARSDRVRFEELVLVDDYGRDPVAAGRTLAARVNAAGPDVRWLCVMPAGPAATAPSCCAVLHADQGADADHRRRRRVP